MADGERIGKLDAARRQLDAAIGLLLDEGDPLAVHTLAHAAFTVLRDLGPRNAGSGFFDGLDEMLGREEMRRLNRVPNFLKHADRDPSETLPGEVVDAAEGKIGLGCVLHMRLTGRMSPRMRAFDAWMHLLNPDELDLPPDPDPEFDAIFRQSLEVILNGDRESRLSLARTLVAFYEEHPDAPGMNAPRERPDDTPRGR